MVLTDLINLGSGTIEAAFGKGGISSWGLIEISAMTGIVCVKVREEVRIVAIRFMWIPGKRPVIVPAINPAPSARMPPRSARNVAAPNESANA